MPSSDSSSNLRLDCFTMEQTNVLKGIGILLIVLHNVMHNLTPYIGENEFSFRFQIFQNFYQSLITNPFDFFRAVFSYFGHYGVQIFVFFSAYGLTRKYRNSDIDFGVFLKGRFNKVYFSFLFCVSVYIVLGILKSTFLTNETVLYWDSILWKVLLISSFIPNQALMPVGPWWFLPFIFQFYLLYPFLLTRYREHGNGFLVFVSVSGVLLQAFVNPYLMANGLNIHFTVFGHLPVLCLGIYFANRSSIKIPLRYALIFAILFILGNFNEYVWTVSGLCFTLCFLACSIAFLKDKSLPQPVVSFLAFFGVISLHLFLVNGFLRSPFHQFAETHNLWWIDISMALASLLFSTVFAVVLRSLEIYVRSVLFPLLKHAVQRAAP